MENRFLTWIWHKRDLAAIEALIDFGEANGFSMSKQSESDGANIMSPDIVSTMYLMRDKLGGPTSIAETFSQAWWVGGQTGFLAHLQVLHIFLRALMNGSVTDGELSLLGQHANDNPANGLFEAIYHKYSDGDESIAANLLLNTQYFPTDSLPTNDNYCESVYLYQRDQNTSDWQPCSINVGNRPGVEFEFAAAIVNGSIK